ncbi:hypothetical protein BG004_002091 [Podila humilis]|nr:hypothetical protein BG004_002091 [Podila humilis]
MFLTAFPPILGYSSFVTMSGYVYGFGYGFLIAYSSALLGSITCFYLGRKYFKKQVRTLMAKKQSVKSVVKAVEKRGFKLLLLIRLAPYPFNILNLTLSATHIPLRTFALATALSLTKLTLHVYIGSTLSSLAPIPTTPKTDDDNKSTTPGTDTGTGAEPIPHGRNNFKIAVMIFSMLLGIAVSAHVWIVAKREIEASEGIRIERRRKRRQSRSSLHNGRGSSSAVSSPGQHYQTHRSSAGLMTAAGTTADYFPSSNDLTSHHHNDIHHHHHTASDFVGGGYLDDQDDDQDEDQEGVSGDAEGRALFQHHNGQQQHPHHRQQGARGDESDDGSSGSDSDRTDFMDDDEYEDDIDDMERGDDGFLDHGSSWRSSIATAAATTTNGSEIEMRSHPNKITTATTTTAATATAGAISAPPTRGPSPRPRVSSGAGAMVEQENIGWFAQNGVDISDRGW